MSLGYPRLSRPLTDGIFETGAYGVPSKSQNPTVLGQGAIRLAPTTTLHFDTVHKTMYLFPNWIFYFLLKKVRNK